MRYSILAALAATSLLGVGSAYADDVSVPALIEAAPVKAATASSATTSTLVTQGAATTVHESMVSPYEGPEKSDGADGSVSCGRANRGSLYGGEALAQEGFGYRIPEPWWQRGYSYGSSHLLDLVRRAAAAVALEHPGAVIGIGDISKPGGGALPGHRSHQSGRDIDLIYYALDANGQPFVPDEHMGFYGVRGRSTYARSPTFVRNIPERYFDLARNWALVRALVTDSDVEVQHIFVSNRVRRWLLRYARRIGESTELLNLASRLLRHPHGASSHNDHMHVRVRCSDRDAVQGRCRDGSATPPRRGRRWYTRVRCPMRIEVAAEAVPAILSAGAASD